MTEVTEKQTIITLRMETIQKNKILSGLSKMQGESYQDIFSSVYNAILGEYFLLKFNSIYNPDLPNRVSKPKKECVLDYLNSESLSHYLECVEHVIYDVKKTGCSVKEALVRIIPRAKVLFSSLSIYSLSSSIEKDVKKHQRQLKKGMVKNSNINSPIKVPEKSKSLTLQTKSCEDYRKEYESWVNSKEFQDYAFEEEGGYTYKNGKYVLDTDYEIE